MKVSISDTEQKKCVIISEFFVSLLFLNSEASRSEKLLVGLSIRN
jgi:hypothetical protein